MVKISGLYPILIVSRGSTSATSFDGCLSAIMDFISSKIFPSEFLELEAKFGTIIDKNTNLRISLPIETEAVVKESKSIRFQSNMPQQLHHRLNQILNKQVESPTTDKAFYMSYQRHKLVDKFYSSHLGNIRITTDLSTGNVIASVVKERIADMHIHFPNSPLDIRISLNVEKPLPKDGAKDFQYNASIIKYERTKNRVSYALKDKAQTNAEPFLTCDLTQVSTSPTEPMSHEFEVELSNPSLLLQENAIENVMVAYWTSIRQLIYAARGL